MMELGATLCSPSSPACGTCPLQDICLARLQQQSHLAAGGCLEDAPSLTQYPCKVGSEGATFHAHICVHADSLPDMQAAKQQRRAEARQVAVVQLMRSTQGAQEAAMHYLLVKRPSQGLLAGVPALLPGRLPAGGAVCMLLLCCGSMGA